MLQNVRISTDYFFSLGERRLSAEST